MAGITCLRPRNTSSNKLENRRHGLPPAGRRQAENDRAGMSSPRDIAEFLKKRSSKARARAHIFDANVSPNSQVITAATAPRISAASEITARE